MNLTKEIHKRRTFAIISHPDAGKTTLTEKLLLFGGAIQTAGAVKSNKIKKHASSDFMDIERQRGISVSTSVMSFVYKDIVINLLDTPGHKDFAEDTYRTLSAVDSVILVIDSVKGVEEQTHKLMEVCRMRAMPVIIFINKMDRDGQSPFDLIDEIEKKLALQTQPITWPIGSGKEFQGVYHLLERSISCFDPNNVGESISFDELAKNERLVNRFGKLLHEQLVQDVSLFQDLFDHIDEKGYKEGAIAPVFFGSAVNNFGIQELLNTFINIAPLPQAMSTNEHKTIAPDAPTLSGFIFKIHANIDPRHRDRIAFFRVCSGVFEKSKVYYHVRLNKKLRCNNPYSFLAKSKEVVDYAFPGDVIGFFDTGNFKIGDTLTEGQKFFFSGIPVFSPEIFKELINKDPMKSKQLEKGIIQLTDEGVAQMFTQFGGTKKIIGCVGELQFEVIQYRLLKEYGASCEFRPLPFYKACWLKAKDTESLQSFVRYKESKVGKDKDDQWVYFAESDWFLQTELKNNTEIQFQFTNEVLAGSTD